ncbi:protease modulator HflC [Verrucomicrobiales bacterium BCK34]|nr:protease modulator HflC [Verrucomicrobiales bacterium BCK34]
MKKTGFGCAFAAIVLAVLMVASGAIYTVSEVDQVIITKFGEPIGEPIVTPGLKFKIPFLHKVNSFDKRILEWDGSATEMPTKDKTYIRVDIYARWAIVDPLRYFQKLRDERSALSRLDDILGSELRNTIAKHELIEVVRTTKDRKPAVEESLAEADMTGSIGKLIPIRRGRVALEKEIYETAKAKLGEFGIELLDVRIKRINYNQSVQERIYERMISERQQIAERFRSEGAGEAAKILGDMEKDLRKIESEAYKTVETLKGEADAKATEIYAAAYDQSPDAAEFYEFVRTMELYQGMLDDSTVVLTTDSDLFKYLKAVKPLGPSSSVDAPQVVAPAAAPQAPAPRPRPAGAGQ